MGVHSFKVQPPKEYRGGASLFVEAETKSCLKGPRAGEWEQVTDCAWCVWVTWIPAFLSQAGQGIIRVSSLLACPCDSLKR